MVVDLLGALEVDVLMFTQNGIYLDWGTLNGAPLSSHALNWVAHHMYEELLLAVYEASN